jgi:diguanylate cyclase (GGDEF)-like protein
MQRIADSWSTQQLVEFMASVSGYTDAESAALGAVEVAAVTLGQTVAAVIGFPRDTVPTAAIVQAATGTAPTIQLPGVGDCACVTAPIEDEEQPGRLLIARAGDEDFTDEEHDLLHGMGRVLALTLRSVRLLASLRKRQALLERLSRLQRSIAEQEGLHDVLDSIVNGAAELLGDECVALRLLSAEDPTITELVSSVGLPPDVVEKVRELPVAASGMAGRVIREDRLVVQDDYAGSPDAIADLVPTGLEWAMAAPVYERGRIAGALVVSTRRADREYTLAEQEALIAFAEHAGLALNEARAAAETHHQAFHDSLTGLPNRALYLDRLSHALARTERTGKEVAVLFADLDGFKMVNDSLGHAAGDELLVMVARRLDRCLRSADTGARFGGDEFAILLEDVESEAAGLNVAARILAAFEAPFAVRGRQLDVTPSLGLVLGHDEADHMLRNADLAMYQAKAGGGNRCVVFEPHMHEAVVRRVETETEIRRAIEREEFLLHYQPVFELEHGTVVGLEALVRWRHPERGLVMPGEFIPLAEETRHILPIGHWVLQEACRQVTTWEERGLGRGLGISVNLSGVQLDQSDLVDSVADVIVSSGIDARRLILEITETALMTDTDANVTKLQALKDLGVQLAVDDFGTGYSSLEYLRRFPIDILKIAKSFVDGLAGPASGLALAQAIVDLAASFGLRVVAEGIEAPEQRRRLIELGCELGQGYHFARPEDVPATETLLAEIAAGSVDHQPVPDRVLRDDPGLDELQ